MNSLKINGFHWIYFTLLIRVVTYNCIFEQVFGRSQLQEFSNLGYGWNHLGAAKNPGNPAVFFGVPKTASDRITNNQQEKPGWEKAGPKLQQLFLYTPKDPDPSLE